MQEVRDFQAPGNDKLVNEFFSWLEFPRLFLSTPALFDVPEGQGRKVIVMPGFGAGDLSTLPLRQYLQLIRYDVTGWMQGSNNGDVLALLNAMKEKTLREADQYGGPVDLIGWSLGGYIAREVARDLPDAVNSVITMGSPVVGGPKYTRVAPVFAMRGDNMDDIERQVDERYEVPLKVPVTAIYSKSDGVVAWEACIDPVSDVVEHVEVNASHLGLGYSADVYRIVARRLAEHAPSD